MGVFVSGAFVCLWLAAQEYRGYACSLNPAFKYFKVRPGINNTIVKHQVTFL
jgi:hypothetical protein